ncbi:MAG: hypothetical protein QXO71_12850 [Candidatus Jordarchaeaceae archaeon]
MEGEEVEEILKISGTVAEKVAAEFTFQKSCRIRISAGECDKLTLGQLFRV